MKNHLQPITARATSGYKGGHCGCEKKLPSCNCGKGSAMKFNDKLEAEAKAGNLPENFAKAVMNHQEKASPSKKHCY